MMAESRESPSTRVTLLLGIRQADDASAWRAFVDLYTPLIFSYCRRRGLQDADCRDVVQNVLVSVHRQIRGFEYDPERGQFRNWLITVTVREISRYLQRGPFKGRDIGGRIGRELADPKTIEADPLWEEEFESHVCQAAMQRIRGEFAPETWQAFESVWLMDQKPAKVARSLGKNPDWVYKAKYRVLQRLKQEVEFLTADRPFYSRK